MMQNKAASNKIEAKNQFSIWKEFNFLPAVSGFFFFMFFIRKRVDENKR